MSSKIDPMDVAGLCPSRLGINAPSGTKSESEPVRPHKIETRKVKAKYGDAEYYVYSCVSCDRHFATEKFDDTLTPCSVCEPSERIDQGKPDNSHYTHGGIEPWTYIKANDLNFFEGSAVKYITRWRHKNGVEDLRKARVYIDELIRQEEGK